MRKLFVGFLFIFLDFTLNLGNAAIGLIPDFIGYLILYLGLTEMSQYNLGFTKAKPFTLGMAIYSFILYAMDLLSISASMGFFSIILGILSIVFSLYISYTIIKSIQEIEVAYSCILNGEKLMSTWTMMAIFQILTYALMLIPLLAIIAILVCVVFSIIFLVAFNKSKNMFYTLSL